MDPVSLHLISCHLPFAGGVFAASLLGFARARASAELEEAADWALIGVALAAAMAWVTGPAAREALGALVDPAAAPFANRHTNLGELAAIAWAAAGAVALWRRFLLAPGSVPPRWGRPALYVLVAIGLSLSAWAGHEGGRIRHNELRAVEVLPGTPTPDSR